MAIYLCYNLGMSKVSDYFGLVRKKITPKRVAITFIAISFTICAAGAGVVYWNSKHQIIKSQYDNKNVVSTKISTIAAKTDELVIKEWNLKMPINGNILGKVTYKIENYDAKDNNGKNITLSDVGVLTLSSSKFNELDLSSDECKDDKASVWGFRRTRPSEDLKNVSSDFYRHIDNYSISFIIPNTSCNKISTIYAAFNYALSGLVKF